jgi:hypothetical protein
MRGRLEACGGWPTRPERRLPTGAQFDKLPRIAASRKPGRQFAEGRSGASKGGRRIDNPPQDAILPHKIVAAREETDGQ